MSDPLDALGYEVPDDLDQPCEVPDGAAEADRMLRTLRRLAARLREVQDVAEKGTTDLLEIVRPDLERIVLWRDEETRKLTARYEWLERGVAGWAAAVNKDDPKRKTISLPNGEVTIRTQPTRVVDHAPLLDLDLLRQTRPEWVRETLELAKQPVKAGVVPSKNVADTGPEAPEGYESHAALDKETGEAVPGVFILVPTSPKVEVTPS